MIAQTADRDRTGGLATAQRPSKWSSAAGCAAGTNIGVAASRLQAGSALHALDKQATVAAPAGRATHLPSRLRQSALWLPCCLTPPTLLLHRHGL